MQKAVNQILRRFGLEIQRAPKKKPQASISPEEASELESLIDRFLRQRDADDTFNAKSMRGYLSDKRIAFFHSLLDAVSASGIQFAERSIADVGCGTGYLLRLIEKRSRPLRLVGFDTFVAMNEFAKLACTSATIVDRQIAQIEENFDLVFCTEVLEHLVDPSTALIQMLAKLNAGGALVLTVPNGRTDQQSAGKMREDGTAYWGHVNFWSPESWQVFLRNIAGDGHEVQTDTLSSGENLAIIRATTSTASSQ